MSVFTGETIDGNPVTQWPDIHAACAKHKKFVVEIRRYDEKREVTLKQYAYFHGVVTPVLAEAMSCSKWEAEFWCKRWCGEEWGLIKKIGPGMWVECSKTKLDVQQFNRWLENIWDRADKQGIHVPAPDREWWKRRIEPDKAM